MKQLARVYWYWSGAVFVIVGLYLSLAILSSDPSASGEYSGMYVNQLWFMVPITVMLLVASFASFLRRSWASVIDTIAWLALGAVLLAFAAFGGMAWLGAVLVFTVGMILLAWLPRLRAELGVVGTPSEAPR